MHASRVAAVDDDGLERWIEKSQLSRTAYSIPGARTHFRPAFAGCCCHLKLVLLIQIVTDAGLVLAGPDFTQVRHRFGACA